MLCAGRAPGDAQSASTYNDLGVEAYQARQYLAAIDYFEQAYEQAPEKDTLHRNLCNAYQARANELAKAGDLEQAAKLLELALGADPENASPLVQLGSYYLRMHLVSDAVFRLEEAIQIAPGRLDAHELLGQAYYEDNDLPEARVQWDYVLEKDPNRRGLQERYEKAFREEAVEADFRSQGSRHFDVTYPPRMTTKLRFQAISILERAHMDIGRKFGGVYPPPPVNVILYSSEQFTEATQLDAHVGAVYDGKIRAPVTDRNDRYLTETELKRRLTHEYVHVVVRHLVGTNAPWWLNEGLAEAFSREMDADARKSLKEAYGNGAAVALADLEGSQLKVRGPAALRLAYLQAHAAVDTLWTRYGQRRMTQFFSDLQAGLTPEEALRRTYRKSYSMLEDDIKNSLR